MPRRVTSTLPSFVLGYHGCDKRAAEKILAGDDDLKPSDNKYDWLGAGIYFWENDPSRALNFATHLRDHPKRGLRKITEPFVIGAVIDLGNCLNLLEYESLQLLKMGYELLCEMHKESGLELPQNKPGLNADGDLLLRHLDRAVIETIHRFNEESDKTPYDSVRAAFWEGAELYPNAGFREKNHIQVCVRDPACIRGYFRPIY
ncbi:MAG: hypothetical protein IT488_11665 [Gammaproteobacteria bacterium]|nr:hypothetical protein [Gammaproteobacteria bacterium]